ncbi:MAG: alpha/beta hydrolase [Rubrivivax sp.]|nr:alpha/beta hydrolase [Rubrivivax sp.]
MSAPRAGLRPARPPWGSGKVAEPRLPERVVAPSSPPLGTIVFGHANGFPAGTYRVLFEAWRAAGWRVEAVEKFGHDPRYPVSGNWPRLREQLLDFVDAVSPDAPVHMVGHSLGGYLGLLAACRRPARVASLLLLDSPVLAGWRAHSVQVMKLTRLMPRVSPGRVSRTRRWQWPSAAAAQAHFAAKHAFARWDARVLADYIAAGTEPDPDAQASTPGAVRLAFRREIETRIYDTLPHRLGTLIHRHPPAGPVGFIGGTQSTEVRQVGLAATRALTRGRIEWIEGSHLYPMERPDETAAAVLRWLDEVQAAARPAPARQST